MFCLQNISDEKFENLFNALPGNTHLECMSLTNVGLTDRTAVKLADALEKNSTLRVVNIETNFISPIVIVQITKSLLKTKTVEEFRATNQVIFLFYVSTTVIGVKIKNNKLVGTVWLEMI